MARRNTSATSDPTNYPLANTQAARMISEAIRRAEVEKGWSQRYLAGLLGYKNSVIMSHMALGRTPIPVDRVSDIARLLNMEPGEFLLAVLEQRHPDIDFARLIGAGKVGKAKNASPSVLVDELESITRAPLDDLPVGHVNVLREVVGDPDPQRRWIMAREVAIIEAVREAFPQGLTPSELVDLKRRVADKTPA